MKWLKTLVASFLLAIFSFIAIFLWIDHSQETISLTNKERKKTGKNFISLKSGTTAYRIIQNSNSSNYVLLIHGGGVTGDYIYENQIDFLSQTPFNVISYDLLGRGLSERIDTIYSSSLLSNQLSELLDSLKIDSLHSIIAMSMGASIAMRFLHNKKWDVKNLILIDPAATGQYNPNPILEIPIISSILMTLYWYPRAIENQRKEFVDMELFEIYSIQLKHYMNFKGYKKINYSTWMNIMQEDNLSYLNKIENKTNVVVIYGNKDPYFSESSLIKYKEVRPNLKSYIIKEAGHMPHYEKPLEVNEIIKRTIIDH